MDVGGAVAGRSGAREVCGGCGAPPCDGRRSAFCPSSSVVVCSVACARVPEPIRKMAASDLHLSHCYTAMRSCHDAPSLRINHFSRAPVSFRDFPCLYAAVFTRPSLRGRQCESYSDNQLDHGMMSFKKYILCILYVVRMFKVHRTKPWNRTNVLPLTRT